jgi:23S rRNA (uracil1939-C5)-methyltransferase
MVAQGDLIELDVEKPAAGGRMIARHQGQVVLVLGGIPGERVRARVDRVVKRLAFASVVDILTPSADRRSGMPDPLCGGCLYANVDYARQVALKSEVIGDAFLRIGRIPLESAVPVAGSPESGYRLRARLHAVGGRAGFFREGTHQLCDAAATGQLLPESLTAIETALSALGARAADVASIEISENVAGDERALHLDVAGSDRFGEELLSAVVAAGRLTGCSARSARGAFTSAGAPAVADPLAALTGGRAAGGELRRHAVSFFQGNRFLIADLVGAVIDALPPGAAIIDLYAGVGLFAVSLAAAGRDRITAVEGDRESGADLLRNALPYSAQLQAIVGRVEDQVRRGTTDDALIVDPPRTGISREAMDAVVQLRPVRIVYVSCDPPTMARDARRLLDAGYRIASMQGFDLFPNTPHVETVGVFERS